MRPDTPPTDQSTDLPSPSGTPLGAAVPAETPGATETPSEPHPGASSRAAPSAPDVLLPADWMAIRSLLKEYYGHWVAAKAKGEKPPVPQIEQPGHFGEVIAYSVAGWAHSIWQTETHISEDMWANMVWLYYFTCSNIAARSARHPQPRLRVAHRSDAALNTAKPP